MHLSTPCGFRETHNNETTNDIIDQQLICRERWLVSFLTEPFSPNTNWFNYFTSAKSKLNTSYHLITTVLSFNINLSNRKHFNYFTLIKLISIVFTGFCHYLVVCHVINNHLFRCSLDNDNCEPFISCLFSWTQSCFRNV